MNKIIITKTAEGGVAVTRATKEMFEASSQTRQHLAGLGLLTEDASEKEIWDFIVKTTGLNPEDENTTWRFGTEETLPQSRTFRDAWTDEKPTNTVDVDLPKAKEIKLEELRKKRAPLLAQLDVDYVRALEKNDTVAMATIVSKKQELRDVTKVSLPSDLTSLETFLPDALK